MESRKIQLVGKRSYAISLPKEWVRRNKLKEQENVFLELTENDDVLIRAGPPVETKEELVVKAEEVEQLAEFLMLCYVKGLHRVVLKLGSRDHERRTQIRTFLKYLEGFDITAEDESRIEIAFLFTDYTVTVDQTMRRMVYLCKLLLEGIIAKDARVIEETEMVIDRLHHLTTRLLFACLRNGELRRKNGLRSDEEVFFYKDISKRMEHIGDNLCLLEDESLSTTERSLLTSMLSGLSQVMNGKLPVLAFRDEVGKARTKLKGSSLPVQRLADLCEDITESLLSLRFNKHYF